MIIIKDNPVDKEELVSDYADRIVSDMDIDTLIRFAYDIIVAEKMEYEDGRLLEEVEEYYPDILVAELKQLIEQFAKKVQKPALAET